MADDQLSSLLREIAGIRTILVHVLARLKYEELKAISESISKDFDPFTPGGIGPQTESERDAWMNPYRNVIDRILAQAEKLRGQQESGEQGSPQRDP